MAKKKLNVGSVLIRKDGSHYIKINGNHNISDGQFLNLENEKTQLAQIDYKLKQGWIDEAAAEKQKEQVRTYWNAPVKTRDGSDFVRSKSIRYQITLSVEE